MNRGDLVYYRDTGKSFYIVTRMKKYYHGFKDRVKVISPLTGNKIWFLKEDLEVLSEGR